MASYNYLGFAQNEGPCAEDAIKAIKQYGISSCSSRRLLGDDNVLEINRLKYLIKYFYQRNKSVTH